MNLIRNRVNFAIKLCLQGVLELCSNIFNTIVFHKVVTTSPSLLMKDWAFNGYCFNAQLCYYEVLPVNLYTCELSKWVFLKHSTTSPFLFVFCFPVLTCFVHIASIKFMSHKSQLSFKKNIKHFAFVQFALEYSGMSKVFSRPVLLTLSFFTFI